MLRREVLSPPAALVFLLSFGVAIAQETAQPAAQPAAEERAREIVVTGTRIKRQDPTTPGPMTIITRDRIVASGRVSIGDFLQTLPEQGNAINTAVNNGGDGATRVNLRGIGSQYTLVLVNGRRLVPGGTGADDSADLNSIPTAAIERIEVLKDGASAVYGSDAIAGVVNIITRRGWNGTEVAAYGGASSRSDGQIYDLNFAHGTSGALGSVIFGVGFYQQKKVMAGDRDFSRIPVAYDTRAGVYSLGSGTIPQGRVIVPFAQRGINDPNASALWNSLMAACTAADRTTCPDSYIRDPSATGAYAGLGWRPYAGAGLVEFDGSGDGYNYALGNYLVTPAQRISLYSSGDVRFGGFARGFFEASYLNRQSGQDLAAEPLFTDFGVVISARNAYNPFAKDLFGFRRRLLEFGPRTYRQDLDTFRVVAGVEGTLPDVMGPVGGWTWDLSFNYGRTQGTTTKAGNLFLPQLQAALGPSFNAGTPAAPLWQCSTDGTAQGVIPGCVPLNLFGGPGSITQDQVAPLTFTGTARGTNQLSAFQANVGGGLGRLRADRPVNLAVGYEFRVMSGSSINDPVTNAGLTSGRRTTDTRGNYDANEVYGELSMPIASGMPGADDLELSAAVRWFKYSTFGSDGTYELGGRWRPFRDITFRGTYGTAFRAPSISDLYQGRLDSFGNVSDPCRGPPDGPALTPTQLAQCGAAANNGDDQSMLRSTLGGNPNLDPETAKIWTAGVVIEPASLVKNLSLTLDFYSLEIEKNIAPIGEPTILRRCYDGSAPQYCALVSRNPTTHFIDLIYNLQENAGKLATAGLDLAIRYALPTPSAGRFGFSLDATWLQKVDRTLPDGTVVHGKNTFDLWTLNSNGGAGGTFPSWKANASVTWGLGGLGVGLSTRFLGSFHECGEPYDSNGDGIADSADFSGVGGMCYVDSTFQRKVAAYHTEDLFVSYTMRTSAGKTDVMLGVQNLGDMPPAKIYNGFASSTDQYNYDQMGRFFYVRLAQTY